MASMLQQDVTFHDDEFNFDPSTLNQTAQRRSSEDGPMPAPGYYKVRVVAGGVKTDRENKTTPVLDKKGNPVFAIQRIAIMEPEEAAGSHGIFQDIYTNGFQPKNWKTGETLPGPKVYPFIQLLAAIDVSAVTADFNENLHELGKLLTSNPVLTVRLGYTATDVAYAKAQIAQGVDKKAAYKAAELKPAAFRNQDNTWRTEAQGPSGEMIAAKLRITEWVASNNTSIELGPLKMRQAK